MIKFIHTADLHLDSKMESNLSQKQAAQRRNELLDTFERLVEYGRNEKVAAILIAGDMFDRPHIRKIAKTRVLDVMRENPGIDFLYLKGNHDKTDFPGDIPLEEIPANLKLFRPDNWTSYSYGEGGRVTVSGRELNSENARAIAANLILDVARINIVMLHGQRTDYVGRDKTPAINIPQLKGKYIDYLALGHIHGFQADRLDDRGEYCYCGTLEGRGFDECGEKGFVLLAVDEENNKIDYEFIPFASRTLHSIAVTVSPEDNMPDIISNIKSNVADIPDRDLVKVILTGSRELDFDVDRDRIRSLFSKKFFFFKVYDESEIKIDYDSFINDRSLKGEFVRLMQSQKLPENQRAEIIDLGMRALLGHLDTRE